MSEFLAMGGYGTYVWLSCAIFFLVLAIEAWAPRMQRARILADLRGRLRRRDARNVDSR